MLPSKFRISYFLNFSDLLGISELTGKFAAEAKTMDIDKISFLNRESGALWH